MQGHQVSHNLRRSCEVFSSSLVLWRLASIILEHYCPIQARDRVQFGEAEKCFYYYIVTREPRGDATFKFMLVFQNRQPQLKLSLEPYGHEVPLENEMPHLKGLTFNK